MITIHTSILKCQTDYLYTIEENICSLNKNARNTCLCDRLRTISASWFQIQNKAMQSNSDRLGFNPMAN